MAPSKHKFIAVAGVMGSGKTSACKLLADRLKFEMLEEKFVANPFPPLFYQQPSRWAFASQLFHLKERALQLEKIPQLLKNKTVVQDSPIFDDYLTYAKAAEMLGNMSADEFALYSEIFVLASKEMLAPDLIIHLQVTPKVILERIKTRGREFEKSVELPYLELLSKLQGEWIRSQ